MQSLNVFNNAYGEVIPCCYVIEDVDEKEFTLFNYLPKMNVVLSLVM